MDIIHLWKACQQRGMCQDKRNTMYFKFRYTCVTCMYIQTLLISLVAIFSKLIASISTSHVCKGNSDENFIGLPNIHRGVMKDVSS